MLYRWANKQQEIEKILEMLAEFEARGFIEWTTIKGERQAVCEYFEIDLSQLDQERRALLEKQRKLNDQATTIL